MSDRDFGNEDGPSFPETDAKEARDFEEYEVRSANEAQKAHDEFMKGYRREITVTGKLLSALVKCMERHPTLRVGQLLVAVMVKKYGNVEDALFVIQDEEIIKLLDEF